jgi:[ribosomal protein S5]-alanine N-acetyltransferase
VRELQLLRPDHESAVMAFELANRAFFAMAVPDRGDAYLEHLTEHLNELVADQEAGIGAFYVLVDDDASVLGRFNLELGPAGAAELGFRVAQHVCGQGVATATVRGLCHLAATRHGARTLRAAAAHSNAASQRVLTKAGFVPVGPAEPEELGGKPGTWYQRDLTVESRPDEPSAATGHAAVEANHSKPSSARGSADDGRP